MRNSSVDKPLLISIIILAVAGFFIFSSASLGLLAREGSRFTNVAFSQTFYGLFLGTIALIVLSKIHYRFWRKHSLIVFVGSLILTLLVFTPLGVLINGARRWVSLFSISFQPSEFLKIGYIIYLAAWLSGVKQKVETMRFGLLPFAIISAVAGLVLLSQPDTDTFLVMCASGLAMFIVAGARFRDVGIIILTGLIGLSALVMTRPYLMERFTTFLDPSRDAYGSSYQIRQSLIAIGSGGITGRGFGQSIQKFNYLPEPIGDSIFAVAAEEFGFIGSLFIIGMFLFFALRGLKIAARAPDIFGGLVATGIVILILSQSFINIASMMGVFPLSGIPLLFISHGGTALLITLAEVGILLNISKYQKTA